MDAAFPPDFFDRLDPSPDPTFYGPPRLVTHIDEGAIAAVGALYEELGVGGRVLDLMPSWISHFRTAPRELVGLGMNERELQANPARQRFPRRPRAEACRASARRHSSRQLLALESRG